jgi:hypothetical protein
MNHCLSPVQTSVEGRQRANEGFSERGNVVVLANALSFAAEPLHQAQLLLPELTPGENSAKLNGYLYVASVLLQSVLDGVASTAHKLSPLPDPQGDIYFKSYQFVASDVVWIGPIQRRLLQIQYRGKSFFEFTDGLKHEHAWVGCVSEHPVTNVLDVHDEGPLGYLYGVLVPVYNAARSVICRLAHDVDQPSPSFYKL